MTYVTHVLKWPTCRQTQVNLYTVYFMETYKYRKALIVFQTMGNYNFSEKEIKMPTKTSVWKHKPVEMFA
jgi:hypothetical protein